MMLKRLKIKFVCFNMCIVTVMLCVILGLVIHFTQAGMERSSIDMMERMAYEPILQSRPDDISQEVRLPFFTLQLGPTGELTATSGSYYDLSDRAFLQTLIDVSVSGTAQTGIIDAYNLRYCRVVTPTGVSLVFSDITSERTTMAQLWRSCIAIGVAGFLVFLVISLFMAKWAVGPVAKAWDQQKQFVSDASHELKTPLTVILSNAQMLKEPDFTEADRQQFADSILTVSQQMRTLVERLLELARADGHSRPLHRQRVDFSRVTEQALLPFEPVFYERELELVCQLDAGITLKGDAGQLRQAVEVLLDNAQKYCAGHGTVTVLLRRQRGRCLLSVATDGAPISREDLKNIFKRFYRSDQVRTMNGSYGLGLAIAEQIVTAHHGKIWAESGDGVNTFYIQLPTL